MTNNSSAAVAGEPLTASPMAHDMDERHMVPSAPEKERAVDYHVDINLRRQEIFSILLLCAAVFAIGLPWHVLNHRLPIWDEAEYVLNAQKIIAAFHRSLIEGLHALYFSRGWRTIIFPAVASPFFALARGNILLASGLTQLFSQSLIAVYAFLLLRQFLMPFRAFVGAMFAVTAPWLVNFSYGFFSEVFWMAATLGWAFHFLAGLDRKSRIHLLVSGVWLGLMIATRPAESVLIASLPLVFATLQALRRREVLLVDITVFLAQVILMSLAVWQRIEAIQTGPLVWALLTLCVLIVTVRWRRFFLDAPILGLAIISEFICVAWYLPALPALYAWAYEASFGPLAEMSKWARFSDRTPATLWTWFVTAYHPLPLGYIIVLALTALVLHRHSPTLDRATYKALRVIGLSLLMLVPMLTMLLVSGTNDSRRLMPEVLTFYVGAVGLALMPSAAVSRFRLAAVMLVALLQYFAAGANALALRWAVLPAIADSIGTYRPPFLGEDNNMTFLADLRKSGFGKGSFDAYTVCYRDPVVDCSGRGLPWFEVEGATALAVEENLPMQFNMARDLDFAKPSTLAAQVEQRGFDFVIVDMFYDPDRIIPGDPLFEHAVQFIDMVKNGLPPGFREAGKFAFGDRQIYVLSVE